MDVCADNGRCESFRDEPLLPFMTMVGDKHIYGSLASGSEDKLTSRLLSPPAELF